LMEWRDVTRKAYLSSAILVSSYSAAERASAQGGLSTEESTILECARQWLEEVTKLTRHERARQGWTGDTSDACSLTGAEEKTKERRVDRSASTVSGTPCTPDLKKRMLSKDRDRLLLVWLARRLQLVLTGVYIRVKSLWKTSKSVYRDTCRKLIREAVKMVRAEWERWRNGERAYISDWCRTERPSSVWSLFGAHTESAEPALEGLINAARSQGVDPRPVARSERPLQTVVSKAISEWLGHVDQAGPIAVPPFGRAAVECIEISIPPVTEEQSAKAPDDPDAHMLAAIKHWVKTQTLLLIRVETVMSAVGLLPTHEIDLLIMKSTRPPDKSITCFALVEWLLSVSALIRWFEPAGSIARHAQALQAMWT
jgi:hypothetical protein